MRSILSEKGEISIVFPKNKFQRLLQMVGVEKTEDLTPDQIRSVFIQSVRDFLTGENSSDDVSEIAAVLLTFLREHTKETDHKEIKDVLDTASEMSFYIRHKDHEIFPSLLKVVIDYVK